MGKLITVRFDSAIPLAFLQGMEDRSEKMQPAGKDLVKVLHRGVQRQFLGQYEATKKGRRRQWKQSIRAKEEGGLTMIDTGAYVRAWTGRGAGSLTRVTDDGVEVGVSRSRFPRVGLFQGRRTIRGVVPRRVGLSPQMLEASAQIMVNHVVGRRG